MHKTLIDLDESMPNNPDVHWLSIKDAASVEVTSESRDHPVEFAFTEGEMRGWKAGSAGRQLIRICFHTPTTLSRITLQFERTGRAHTQEYVLRWSTARADARHEIARQQWNFSSPDANVQSEVHQVSLQDVSVLELLIIPDISNESAYASLARLRLAA